MGLAGRLGAAALCLGSGGCNLLLGIPDLADPGNLATMTARFKAAVQADRPGSAPIDWGPGDSGIWRRYLGPQVVLFCGQPVQAPAQRYELSFSRGSFGTIEQHDISTPSHPGEGSINGLCEKRPER